MTDPHRNRYRLPAVAILVAGVAAEALRLNLTWPGFNPSASRFVSVLLIVLWATAAVVLLARSRLRSLASSAWAIAMAAALAMFVHGPVTRVGGSWIGLGYLPAALVLGFFLKRTFIGRRSPFILGYGEPEHPGTPGSAHTA